MNRHRLSLLVILAIAPTAAALAGADTDGRPTPLTACPVTAPQRSFSPPGPFVRAPSGAFWYGTERLWTLLPADGSWQALPRSASGLRQKVFWWRRGFDGRVEPRPNLSVKGRRLDGKESFMQPPPATNAFSADLGGWAMLTGIEAPTPGCWEISGSYRDTTLTFVVRIAS